LLWHPGGLAALGGWGINGGKHQEMAELSMDYDDGLSMDYLWIIYGLSMVYLWIIYGLSMDYLWFMMMDESAKHED